MKWNKDIVNKKGNVIGAIGISISKDGNKKEIILMKNDRTISVRSTTALMNKLRKMNVSFEERKKLIAFTANRLEVLESDMKKEKISIKDMKKLNPEKRKIKERILELLRNEKKALSQKYILDNINGTDKKRRKIIRIRLYQMTKRGELVRVWEERWEKKSVAYYGLPEWEDK